MVIAIVGVLTTISLPVIRDFQSRAKESEGSLNVRTIYALIHNYLNDENDRLSNVGLGLHFGTDAFTRNNFHSENSCKHFGSVTHEIGFKMEDCRKINYVYYYFAHNRKFGVIALEGSHQGSKRVYSKCCGASMWVANEAGLFHSIRPSTPTECILAATVLAGAAMGSNNSSFDLNGDGTVTVHETLAISSYGGDFNLEPGSTPMDYLSSCP